MSEIFWGALASGLFAAVISAFTQRWIASKQSEDQKKALAEKLSMQEVSSRRIASATIADKRQDWINELRKDIARYVCLWQDIGNRSDALKNRRAGMDDDFSNREFEESSRKIIDSRTEADEILLRIMLRLNMKEEKHEELLKLIKDLPKYTNLYSNGSAAPKNMVSAQIKITTEEITQIARKILKEEWERIKQETYVNPIDTKQQENSTLKE